MPLDDRYFLELPERPDPDALHDVDAIVHLAIASQSASDAVTDSVNRLLVVGFYLINAGYVTLAMRTYTDVESSRQAIELVCDKIGVVLLVLGTMHFINLYIFNRLRRNL